MADSTPDPRSQHRQEEFPGQQQDQPGLTDQMRPVPDHGEQSYVCLLYTSPSPRD